MRRKIAVIIAVVSFLLSSTTVFAEAPEGVALDLLAKSAVLMEQETGKILFEKNAHEKLPPASITKVMTLLLIYEAQANGAFAWEDMVQVSEHAASMGGSQVYLEAGETQRVADMVKCIAIASANDAAVAMAEFVSGSEEAFVGRMNEKAKQLEMRDTNFVNACGLDADGHVTSAYDIAVMSRELMRNFPEIQEYTTTWQDAIIHRTNKGESEFGLTNTNKLIKWYEGATGLKTGSTGNALYCLSGTAQKDDLALIGVVMAAPDYKTRFQEVMKMFDFGFANYTVERGYPIGELMGYVKVDKGQEDEVKVVVKGEVFMLTSKGAEVQWETQTHIIPTVKAPIAGGTKVGELIYFMDGESVARTDIITSHDIEKANIYVIFKKLLRGWC